MNLKILYKNMGFGGGAPKSLLQYVKVAMKNDIETVVVGQHTYDPKDYKESNIRLIDLPHFVMSKPFRNFCLFMKYMTIIKDEKPDVIHATTQVNCYFHRIISKVNNIPIVYNIPGGRINRFTAVVMGNENLLVYSEENKLELINYGYDINKITVISNRIDTSESNNEYTHHYNSMVNKGSEIRFLLTSRMSDMHLNSIKYIINIVKKLNLDNFNVKLDILGDGKNFETIKNIATEVNDDFEKSVIIPHGFINNVSDYIKKAHVVFGKGRSVIDGIMNCRVSFVVSENETLCHCNLETFENLRTYNFAGRNMEYITSYVELAEIISNLYQSKFNLKELKLTTREFYDIELAEGKIMNLYKKADNGSRVVNYKPNFLTILKEYILLYIKMIKVKRKAS